MTTPAADDEQIKLLLSQLAQKPPRDEQKSIRRQLRALGHWGGLHGPNPKWAVIEKDAAELQDDQSRESGGIWKIAPGKYGAWWQNFQAGKCAYIGFSLQ